MNEHSDCMPCSMGGAGGDIEGRGTADGSGPGDRDMGPADTAPGVLKLLRTPGGGGVRVGGASGVLAGVPKMLGDAGLVLSLGFEKPKKPARGGEKTGGVGV